MGNGRHDSINQHIRKIVTFSKKGKDARWMSLVTTDDTRIAVYDHYPK